MVGGDVVTCVQVLDTATGLGYTAIAASRCTNVREVVTVELDQAALELCKVRMIQAHSPLTCEADVLAPPPPLLQYNPWSSELFNGLKMSKIRLMQGDICEVIKTFPEGWFSVRPSVPRRHVTLKGRRGGADVTVVLLWQAVIHDPPSPSVCKSNRSLFASSFYSELYRVLRWRGRLFHFVGGNPRSKEFGPVYRAVMQKLEAVGFKSLVIQAAAQGIVCEKGEDRKSKKGRAYAERQQRLRKKRGGRGAAGMGMGMGMGGSFE
jgi:predicted methyltransferase